MTDLISIKRNGDFRRVYARGKSVVTSSLVIYYYKNHIPILSEQSSKEEIAKSQFLVLNYFVNSIEDNYLTEETVKQLIDQFEYYFNLDPIIFQGFTMIGSRLK